MGGCCEGGVGGAWVTGGWVGGWEGAGGRAGPCVAGAGPAVGRDGPAGFPARPGGGELSAADGLADGVPERPPFAAGLPLAPPFAALLSARPGRPPGIRRPPSGSEPASRCLAASEGEGCPGSLTLMHPPRARVAAATAASRVNAVACAEGARRGGRMGGTAF
ncbi:hypothetical protein [Streptomyces mashuensis]|uniref:hypothetical protein n=1 Tax=Streptomyces mashuensis TaxID=33904 RepID=UPI00167E2C24|nr:hypothetical protein [Streptomyces mashuensis]